MFQDNDYGKPISEKLSATLRRNATKNDFANIASRSNISFSTIRDVVYRTNSLTKSNSRAIKMLTRTAFKNSISQKIEVENDIVFFDETLNT